VLFSAELPARKGVFPSPYARFSEIPLARHIIPLVLNGINNMTAILILTQMTAAIGED
jgi:hypothetical protein